MEGIRLGLQAHQGVRILSQAAARRTSHCPMFTGPSSFTQLLPPDSLSFLYTEPWQTSRADPGSSTPPWPLYNPQKSANISVFYFFFNACGVTWFLKTKSQVYFLTILLNLVATDFFFFWFIFICLLCWLVLVNLTQIQTWTGSICKTDCWIMREKPSPLWVGPFLVILGSVRKQVVQATESKPGSSAPGFLTWFSSKISITQNW